MTLDLLTVPERIDLLHGLLGGTVLVLLVVLGVLLFFNRRLKAQSSVPGHSAQALPASKTAPSEHQSLEQGSLQLLSLLQAEARFLDFVEEDLSAHGDADIGAAARVVHQGCQKLIHRYFEIQPIHAEPEGTQVLLEKGFDPARYRLTGQVVGDPPFRGQLVHRGWKVQAVHLPTPTPGHDFKVLLPAEVEL
jgi:hypothetical protein